MIVSISVGGIDQIPQPKIDADNGTGGGLRLHFYLRAEQGNIVFPGSGLGHGSGQDASLNGVGHLTAHLSQLGEPDSLICEPDRFAAAAVGLPGRLLGLEFREAGSLAALLHPPEEVLIGIIQVPQSSAERGGIHFPQPLLFPLQGS